MTRLPLSNDCLGCVLRFMTPRERCALRATTRAHRTDVSPARCGMIPCVFRPYLDDVFTHDAWLTPYDYFAHFAAILLGWDDADHSCCIPRRRRVERHTLLLEVPLPLSTFSSRAQWVRHHFEHPTAPRYFDDVYRLPLMLRLRNAEFRTLQALVY